MILNLLLIAFIMVNLIDLSGFITEVEKILSKWLKINAHITKPFSCSYCSTHWLGLFYILLKGEFSLVNYSILLLICFLTPEINDICILIKQAIQRVLGTFFDLTDRNK